MKKGLVLCTTMVLTCALLTGCHLKHEWQEATCTEPRTCMIGGETEGEPLGHKWEEATCTEPKICSVCGKTEGEALGHGILTKASYQQGAVCTVCGHTIGEPLEADFEKYGFVCNTDFDTPYTYETVCYDDESLTTMGTVTFSDYLFTDSFEFFEVPEGYVVQAVTMTYDFPDQNAQEHGFSRNYCIEDYYDIVGHDDSMKYDDGVGKYTISFNGEEYKECQCYIYYGQYSYSTSMVRMYFCVPEGYDGTVIGARAGGANWVDGMYIYDVADENTIFFRLPAASREIIDATSKDSFEAHGLVINAEEGVTYDYVTACSEDLSKETIGQLTFSNYHIVEDDETLENIEGYEWRTVHVTVSFSDENAQNYGISTHWCMSDYFNMKKAIDTIRYYSDQNMRVFIVNYKQSEYTRNVFIAKNDRFLGWKNGVNTYEIDFYFRVPIGYDGAVVCLYDSKLYEGNGNGRYIYDIADENTLFFRLN